MALEIETRIVSHDVGGRGFNVELQYPPAFQDDVIHVLYEADAACAEAMIQGSNRPGFHVAPFCLGASEGSGVLNIMANPYFSSLLEPDPRFQAASCEVTLSGSIDGVPVEGARYDAIYATENQVVRKVPVAIRTLDNLLDRGELPVSVPPDFLSVDTQGTEFDVLQGAKRTIGDHVLGFTTEVEFRPMYRDQKLFSHIFDFAIEQGFDFAGFTHLQEVAPALLPIGQRARDSLAFGDALFLRRLDLLKAQSASDQLFFVRALKLAFIAICFERLGDAIAILRRAFEVQPSQALGTDLQRRRYFAFLRNLHRAATQGSQSVLHTDRGELVKEIKSVIEARGSNTAAARAAITPPSAAVESILIEEGFHTVAALARRRRNDAQPYIPGAVHIPRKPGPLGRVLNLLRRVHRELRS